jgi:hypothetical protein
VLPLIYLQITTDLADEELVDLSMPRNGRRLSGGRIHVDGVVGALAQQAAPL